MKKRVAFPLLTAAYLMFAACGGPNQANQHQKPALSTTFKWLQGTWVANEPTTNFFETWSIEDDSTFKAFSYMLKGKDTLFSERITLAYRMGKTWYQPVQAGENNQQTVQFELVDSSQHQYVFENKLHDFPQRIIYKRVGADSLWAWIEGTEKGIFKKIDFKLARQK